MEYGFCKILIYLICDKKKYEKTFNNHGSGLVMVQNSSGKHKFSICPI